MSHPVEFRYGPAIAEQDGRNIFHALRNYLFGLSAHWYHDADGKLIITHTPLDTKEIPSGFFAQPDDLDPTR
jgi:hypothetical protein